MKIFTSLSSVGCTKNLVFKLIDRGRVGVGVILFCCAGISSLPMSYLEWCKLVIFERNSSPGTTATRGINPANGKTFFLRGRSVCLRQTEAWGPAGIFRQALPETSEHKVALRTESINPV